MSGARPAPAPGEPREAALRLLAWLEARDWRGHDPFDLLLSPLAAPLRPFRWPSVAWVQLGRRSPWDVRPLLAVPPHENPKALALGVMGCLSLARGEAAGRLAARLLAAEAPGGGWGYPFPWANRHFRVPAGTPSGVVTSFVTHALLAAAGRADPAGDGAPSCVLPDGVGPGDLRAAVVRGAAFLADNLRRVATPHGPLLSYTPLDERGVHNASVLAAVVLARGSALPGGEPAWADLARAAARATLGAQRADGSWPYGTSRRDAFVDGYHTGYVLSALGEMDARLGLDGAQEARTRGVAYWRRAFLSGPAVGPSPGRPHPVDLHAVAQGILTLLEEDDADEARRLAGWALAHARLPDGAFAFTWTPGRVNRIPYLRWVQAWMFRALAALPAP